MACFNGCREGPAFITLSAVGVPAGSWGDKCDCIGTNIYLNLRKILQRENL